MKKKKRKSFIILLICFMLMFSLCACKSNITGNSNEESVKEMTVGNNHALDRAYITRFQDVNAITYPRFVFNYPSNWKVTNEEVEIDGESVTIADNNGAEVTYNYIGLAEGINFGTSRVSMFRVDISKVEKSDFIPSYVQDNDYSSLGSFMVSKLKVTGELDMRHDKEFDEVDGSVCYAVLPDSMEGVRDNVRGPYEGEFSFYYGGYISIIGSSEKEMTQQQEQEIIQILKSFRKYEDAKFTYLNVDKEEVITLKDIYDSDESVIFYYFNLDNIYNRNDIDSETSADTLTEIFVLHHHKINRVFITHARDDWETLTVGQVLDIPKNTILQYAKDERYSIGESEYLISAYKENDFIEKEALWTVEGDRYPDFKAPIELDINGKHYAGFSTFDSRGSEVIIMKAKKGQYFTFDRKEDVLINLTREDAIKHFNKKQ